MGAKKVYKKVNSSENEYLSNTKAALMGWGIGKDLLCSL